jgi:hypothetical protein
MIVSWRLAPKELPALTEVVAQVMEILMELVELRMLAQEL